MSSANPRGSPPAALAGRLVMALSHVADLVATEEAVEETTVEVLVLGVDLEDAEAGAAKAELGRWARILAQVRDNQRTAQVAVGALVLRGVPQASAQLAVDTVLQRTQSDVPASEICDTPIVSDVTELFLGELPADTPADATITVRGGPGRVLPGSDAITVTPQQFGPAPTPLTVRITPPTPPGLIWDRITLVSTSGERVVVDVAGRWVDSTNDECTPPPAPPRQSPSIATSESARELFVDPTDRTSYQSITAALAAAPPESRVTVRPGVYPEQVEISRPVSITGDGARDHVVIEAVDGAGIAIHCENTHVSHLTVRSVSRSPVIPAALIDIGRDPYCDIGAVWDSTEADLHWSLPAPMTSTLPNPTVSLLDCALIGRAAEGRYHEFCIEIRDQGRCVSLENCEFEIGGNGDLVVIGGAHAQLQACTLSAGRATDSLWVCRNSSASARASDIRSVRVERTSWLDLDDCLIEQLKAFISGRAALVDCLFTSIQGYSHALEVERGGLINMSNCSIEGYICGVDVGNGGSVHASNARFISNRLAGVRVSKGGAAELVDCLFTPQSPGVLEDKDTNMVSIRNCRTTKGRRVRSRIRH